MKRVASEPETRINTVPPTAVADTSARLHMKDTRYGRDAVEPWEIDLLLGWNEAEMEKEMQLHYAAMGLLDRIKQARITCMM